MNKQGGTFRDDQDISLKVKVRLQPVQLSRSGWPGWITDENWAKQVSALESVASRYEYVEILPLRRAGTIADLEKLPLDVSAYVIAGGTVGGWYSSLVGYLTKLDRPIVAPWDDHGRAWQGSWQGDIVQEAGGCYLCPFGKEDVERILRVLRAMTYLRHLRLLHIGYLGWLYKAPDEEDLMYRFGVQIVQLSDEEFFAALEKADEQQAQQIAKQWSDEAEILDDREERLTFYAKQYVTLKMLLKDNDTHALASCNPIPKDRTQIFGMDIRAHQNEFCQCYYFARLIDEGIPCCCKADVGQLITMPIIMALSGGPAIMGNIWGSEEDIQNNTLVLSHDYVPPSMGDKDHRMKLRDMHGREEGLTGFVELTEGMTVTISGMNRNWRKTWCCTGKVAWTKDLCAEQGIDSCRVNIGVKVKDAAIIGRESVGDHSVLAYGDWTEELRLLSHVMKIKYLNLDGD